MKPLARRDAESLAAFLRQKRFRNGISNRVYACIVRGFLQFLREHGGPPTIPLVKAWLEDRVLQWPLHLVCENAGIVDRFLKWMDRDRAVPRNPFNQLRGLYGPRLAPIVCALVSDDPRELQRLQPPAPYASFLGPLMREHVERMRSLGYLYQTNERALLRFDRFLQGRPELSGQPLGMALDAWRAVKSGPQHLKTVSFVERQLSKAMQRVDPSVVVPPYDADSDRRARQLQRKPFIYTEAQILRLLETTRSFESTKSPLRAASLRMMILLAYCAGLRIGELARLTLADVDLKENIIQIRNTKFFKSRNLPLAPSVSLVLKDYLEVRRELGGSSESASGLFWREPRGGSYSCGGIRNLLTEALRRAGLKPLRGRVGPRIHDLRHSMVCNRMEAWYREGINPQSRLPYLATYLGHKDINSTLAYLTITEQLMQHANERFRAANVGVLGSGSGGGRS
jgi:integrase/recombinase XerD